MKYFPRIAALALVASLSLAGCASSLDRLGMSGAGSSLPPAPDAIADGTVLDEQGLLGLELAYKAARLAGETLVAAGLIRGETALRIGRLDDAAFAALGVARGAYRTGNAASYQAALGEARSSVAALFALHKRISGREGSTR